MSVMAAVLLAHFRRPLRKDLVRLAWGLVLGVLAQIIIGGIVVLTGLNPYANMAHFLVSLVLVANAFVLYRRSGDQPSTYFRTGHVRIVTAIRLVVISSALALVTGTVVTATGPHAGDEKAQRFGFDIRMVAWLHADAVIVLLGVSLALLVLSEISPETKRRVKIFFAATLGQGLVGYAQYVLGLPELLVIVHVLGSTLVWIASWRIWLSITTAERT